MSEVRDPLSVADEALAANIMTGSLDETTLSLTTRNGEQILGIFSHSFLTSEQITELIQARRYVPAGGVANQNMRIGADGQTLEWFTPIPPSTQVQLGSNLLDTPIAASTIGSFNLNDELRLDGTFYFFKFGNEFHIVPASSDPLDAGGGSFVLTDRSITITNGFDKPLNGIFHFIGAGLQGIRGERGFPGQGVPVGGNTGQIISKVDGTDFNTEWTDNISDSHIRSLADERIAAHEMDNTHPEDGLNQGQVDSRVVFGTKEFARKGGRTIQGSDTNFNNRINPNPSGNAGKVPIVNPNGDGYVLGDAPSGYTDAQADARVKAGVLDWAQTDNNTPIPAPKLINAPSGGGNTDSNLIEQVPVFAQVAGFTLPIREIASSWTNGTTLYISPLYSAGSISSSFVVAYNFATRAREPEKDINVFGSKRGMCSDGTTLWVSGGRVMEAFNLATKQRETVKDIPFAANTNSSSQNHGLATDGTTIWETAFDGDNNSLDHVEAYNIITKQRDSSKDFILPIEPNGRVSATALWTDGTTMWVKTNFGILAYNVSTRQRDLNKELRVGIPNNVGNIFKVGDIMYLSTTGADSDQTTTTLSAFNLTHSGFPGDPIIKVPYFNTVPVRGEPNQVLSPSNNPNSGSLYWRTAQELLISHNLLPANGGSITNSTNSNSRTIPNMSFQKGVIVTYGGTNISETEYTLYNVGNRFNRSFIYNSDRFSIVRDVITVTGGATTSRPLYSLRFIRATF